jgi:hypothetical protein
MKMNPKTQLREFYQITFEPEMLPAKKSGEQLWMNSFQYVQDLNLIDFYPSSNL